MVLGHVLPEKNESLLDAYEQCRAHADAKTCCDYALHVAVSWWSPQVHIFTIDLETDNLCSLIVHTVTLPFCCIALLFFGSYCVRATDTLSPYTVIGYVLL